MRPAASAADRHAAPALLLVAGCLALAAPIGHAQQAGFGRYAVSDYAQLNNFGGGIVVRRINTGREVVGALTRADASVTVKAVVLTAAGSEDIAGDSGVDFSTAYGINDRNETVGAINTREALRPFHAMRRGAFRELPLPNGDNSGAAFAINDRSEAAGYTSGPQGEHAVIWNRAGQAQVLAGTPGVSSQALAINDFGDIVGMAGNDRKRAILWQRNGAALALATPAGFEGAEATGISNRGEIAGFATNLNGAADISHALLWGPAGSTVRDLGALPGGNDSRARDVNERGEVVGMSATPNGTRAFIWTPATGMVDLNTRINLPGIVLTDAISINKRGDIVAVGHNGDPTQATAEGSHEDHEQPRRVVVLTPTLGGKQ